MTSKIQDELKSFPEDFASGSVVKEIKMPGKALVIGGTFFGSIEILTTDGSLFLNADSHTMAKYIIYSNRNRPVKILIPDKESEIKIIVEKYENYIDQLIKMVESDYKKAFPGGKESAQLINNIFKILNLIRY